MELADKDAKAFKGVDASIQKLYVPRKQGGTTKHPSKPCYRCGRMNHQAKDCRFADATCHYCKKKGHIAPACLKKKRGAALPNNTKHIAPDDSDADEFKLHTVGSKASQPIILQVDIEGRTLPMELDTGAAFSIISESTYKSTFSDMRLRTSKIFKSYMNEHIPVLGQLNVHVRYGRCTGSHCRCRRRSLSPGTKLAQVPKATSRREYCTCSRSSENDRPHRSNSPAQNVVLW